MKELIYLDNSATTKPCDEAVKAALFAMEENYGNPSSLYEFGMLAEDIVTDARVALAKKLSCRDDEVYFTASGSESNNTAIYGATTLLRRSGKHIITTSIEHPSVLEPIANLEKQGYEVTYLKPDEFGNISAEELEIFFRVMGKLTANMEDSND